MSEELRFNPLEYDKAFSPCIMKNNQINTFRNNAAVPQEIFRNDTTAVEVIVKQVKDKKVTESSKQNVDLDKLINENICADIEYLKKELNKAHTNLENTKKCFRVVMFEMRKQLEAANQRELKTQTKYSIQQLEKEKLKTMLESKTNLVSKLKKELFNMKRTIKVVTKGLRSILLLDKTANWDLDDSQYTEFESEINTNIQKTSFGHIVHGHEVTYETTFSSSV